MPDFSARSDAAERIDDPALPEAEFMAAIDDLARVNRLLGAYAPTLAFLSRNAAHLGRFSLLDVGAGQGDLLRVIRRWAERRGIEARLTGIDLAAGAAALGRRAAVGAEWVVGDIFDYRPAAPFDFVVSVQFAHHLRDADIVRFVRWMETHARRAWHIGDLHRSRLAWLGFRALGGALGWHPIVRHDGAISVRRGFRRADWRRLLAQAGIDDASIDWRVPFRWSVARRTG